jgi:hypothetical protein
MVTKARLLLGRTFLTPCPGLKINNCIRPTHGRTSQMYKFS